MTTPRFSRRSALAGLGVLAGVITLSACGSNRDPAEPDNEDLDLLWLFPGSEVDRTTSQAIADAFVEANPDYRLEVQLVPHDSYAQKIQTMLASNTGPDIFQISDDLGKFATRGQILALDDFIADADLDMAARFGANVEQYKQQDEQWGMPYRSGPLLVYYNRTMFNDAGLEPPNASWSWETALETFKELTIPGERWGYVGAKWTAPWFSLMHQNGGGVLDDEGRPTFDSPENIEAITWAADLIFKHGVCPTPTEYADMGPDFSEDPAFAAEKVAVNATGFWGISTLADADIDWDIAPLWQGKQQAVWSLTAGLAISKDAANPQAAFDALNFITGVQAGEIMIDSQFDVPANIEAQAGPVMEDPSWMDDEKNTGAIAESSAFVVSEPFVPDWPEMSAAIGEGMGDVFSGSRPASEVLPEIQARLESIVGS